MSNCRLIIGQKTGSYISRTYIETKNRQDCHKTDDKEDAKWSSTLIVVDSYELIVQIGTENFLLGYFWI